MVGEGKLAYTVLVAGVTLLPVDWDLAETLRMGSEHLWRRYGVTVAAEDAPILQRLAVKLVNSSFGMRRASLGAKMAMGEREPPSKG